MASPYYVTVNEIIATIIEELNSRLTSEEVMAILAFAEDVKKLKVGDTVSTTIAFGNGGLYRISIYKTLKRRNNWFKYVVYHCDLQSLGVV